MHSFWRSMLEPLLLALEPRAVWLAARERDDITRLLAQYAAQRECALEAGFPSAQMAGNHSGTVSPCPDAVFLSQAHTSDLRRDISLLRDLASRCGRGFPVVAAHPATTAPGAGDAVSRTLRDIAEQAGGALQCLTIPGLGGLSLVFPHDLDQERPQAAALLRQWRQAFCCAPLLRQLEARCEDLRESRRALEREEETRREHERLVMRLEQLRRDEASLAASHAHAWRWLSGFDQDFHALLGSARWRIGDLTAGLVERVAMRRHPTVAKDRIVRSLALVRTRLLGRGVPQLRSAPQALPEEKELRRAVGRAREAVWRGDWAAAGREWEGVLALAANGTAMAGRARAGLNLARRLADVPAFKERLAGCRSARAAGGRPRIAVYTVALQGGAVLRLPESLPPEADFIVFCDGPAPEAGGWRTRPIQFFSADRRRTALYVKTHPHVLLPGYDLALWLDPEAMLLEDITPRAREFWDSGHALGGAPAMEEDAAREASREYDIAQEQLWRYRSLGHTPGESLQDGFLFFNLRHPQLHAILNTWWAEIEGYSARDQLSLGFALWSNGAAVHGVKQGVWPACGVPVALVPPEDEPALAALLRALPAPFVFPRGGESYAAVREGRIAAQRDRGIEIIICVHNALEATRACLASVENAREERHRLIVVDDGSAMETARFVREYARTRPWAVLLRNETPQGYAGAANQGLEKSSAPCVILLNSDTVVTDGWAGKLADVLFTEQGVGIAGPMSNAAGAQSLPEHEGTREQTAVNVLPPGLTAEDMNRLCESWTPAGFVPHTTLVHGFCMAIRREVLETVGGFDVVHFPRGYGEETDYCLRAVNAGFGLAVAAHTYVFHEKSQSYASAERLALMRAGSEALERLHGRARVDRARQSMRQHPALQDLRGRARALYSREIRKLQDF